MLPRTASPLLHAALIAAVCALSIAANAGFRAPPRFDGAGYAVLAQSIRQGRGYREIDHPDAPRHAHFPPAYPLALAGVWSLTGPSPVSAHLFSLACTLGATLFAWAWFRRGNQPDVAWLMGLALAVNWRWAREGSVIQSEPLFLLIGQAALLAAGWVANRGGAARGLVLGLLLGAAVLTRHVGLALAAAVVADLFVRRRTREALATLAGAGLMIAPWIAWLASVRRGTQVELVPVRGLGGVAAENGLFYARRMIDQLIGPVVEVATVFRPSYATIATALAAIAAGVIVLGWVRLLGRPESRLAGLVPLFTMVMLLAWPFTEAGRFLVPLIPFLIAGAVEGLRVTFSWIRRVGRPPEAAVREDREQDRTRLMAAGLVLAASVPYAGYAAISGRSEAAHLTHRDFDAACAWIARDTAGNPGPVLTRHPGEVFWHTGRTALAPPDDATADQVATTIERRAIAYLLIDDERFALAPKSPLGRFVRAFPGRVERAYESTGERPVVIYRVRNPG